MADYTLNRPQANEFISDSQPIIKDNFTALDDTFGVDHYKFSLNGNPSLGFHNQVTTPLITGAAHPTTTDDPIMYAMQDTANIGVIQYSRGPNDAVPSPITELHAGPISLGAGLGTDILNMNGTTLVIGSVYICVANPGGDQGLFTADFYWNSTLPGFQIINRFTQTTPSSTAQLTVISNGTTLRLKSQGALTINNIYWTLRLHRITV